MKRRNLTLMMAILMTLSLMLSGCGDSQEALSGTVTPSASEPAPEPTGEIIPPEAPEEDAVMSVGRIEGGTYTNSYLGFAMDLDSDWTYYSAEELQEMPENVAEMFADSELGDTINPLTQFTDMMAENVSRMTTINVLYQQLDMQNRIAFATMDEEGILDLTLEQSDMMIEAYAQAGILVSSMEKVPVTFLGEERVGLKTVSTMSDVPYYTLQVFEYRQGEYYATITFASFVEDQTESLVTMCYPVSE